MNWADLPAAAKTRPRRGRVILKLSIELNICCISQELNFIANQDMLRISPISPMRL